MFLTTYRLEISSTCSETLMTYDAEVRSGRRVHNVALYHTTRLNSESEFVTIVKHKVVKGNANFNLENLLQFNDVQNYYFVTGVVLIFV